MHYRPSSKTHGVSISISSIVYFRKMYCEIAASCPSYTNALNSNSWLMQSSNFRKQICSGSPYLREHKHAQIVRRTMG